MTTPSFIGSSPAQLVIFYASLALAMLAGLFHGHAPLARFLQWPFASAFFAAIAGFLYSGIHPHLPPIANANAAVILALPIAGSAASPHARPPPPSSSAAPASAPMSQFISTSSG